jgi:hypothetical protein
MAILIEFFPKIKLLDSELGRRTMTDLVGKTLDRLAASLPGQVSTAGDDGYAAATATWLKPVGRMPRAVVHRQTADDVQSAIRAPRDCGLPLSVRGGVSR